MFSYSFINADCFTLGIDPGDAFFIFDVHNYAFVVTFMSISVFYYQHCSISMLIKEKV